MKVSWKQSAASYGPTDATRNPSTSEPCSSISDWNGGGDSFDIRPQNVSHRAFVRSRRERAPRRSGGATRLMPEVDSDTRELVARALLEDFGPGDVTAEAVVPEDARGRATITQKASGVVFGLEVAGEVFRQTGAGELEAMAAEGEWRDEVPTPVARAEGPARGLLAAERTALNLLCHLSGVATLTARFVRVVSGTDAVILDTRKTTPGLRTLEKAAVAAGGGRNHRMGLDDAVLIKENHSAWAGGLAEAVRRARQAEPGREVEVECRSPDDVER